MSPRRRSVSLARVAASSSLLALACTDSGTSDSGTGGTSGGGSTAGSGVVGGAGKSAGNGGTAGSMTTAGATSSGGATSGGASGRGGSAGGGGANVAGSAGVSAGRGGDAGTSGSAGGGRDPSGGAGGTAGIGEAGTGGAPDGTLGPSIGCGTPTELESGRTSIEVAGKTREYILEIPADYDPSHPYKLIFGWHPWGGTAQQIANAGYFGLESVSDGQAILVAPEGQPYQDDRLGWGNEDGEDIAFLHAMLDRFNAGLCIDQDRIFSTGFSFGAMFSFTLACTAESMMRAIAPQAGNATTSGRCEDGTRPVATMGFVGTDDSLLSVHRQAIQIFVERNGCSTDTTPAEPSWCDGLASSFEPCSCVEYQGCDAGYPVVECEYTAGHQFAPSAGQTLWDFFSQF